MWAIVKIVRWKLSLILLLIQNNGEAAGQTVLHFHMHLIPRYSGDTVNVGWKPGHLTDEDRDEVLKLFQK